MSDRQALFQTIYLEHGGAVRTYLARRAAPQHLDDLVAETFLVAWRKMPDDVDEPLPWLLAVARRVASGHHRTSARRTRLAERLMHHAPRSAAGPPPVPGPAVRPPLARAFAGLSHNEKTALALVAWHDLDHAQAGRIVGCSAATFAVRVSRARAKARTALAVHGPDLLSAPA